MSYAMILNRIESQKIHINNIIEYRNLRICMKYFSSLILRANNERGEYREKHVNISSIIFLSRGFHFRETGNIDIYESIRAIQPALTTCLH